MPAEHEVAGSIPARRTTARRRRGGSAATPGRKLGAMIKSVSSIVLYVADPEASHRFYLDLGFQDAGSGPGMREVRLNWFRIQLVDRASVDQPGLAEEAKAEPRGSGAFIGISVGEFDAFCKRLRASGVGFTGEPVRSSRGNRQVAVKDPDGYNLMLFEAK